MFRLDNQVALVTGASGGLGSAIARTLWGHGATVVLSGTRRDALESLAAELGERAICKPADLSQHDQLEPLITSIEQELGKLDILVNNAGLTRDNLSIRMKDEEWQKVIDVNLSAAFYLTRTALKGMMKRRHGRVINISSVIGVTGNAGQANYAAAKAGMIGMTKSLAREVASRGVTLNCIAPGFIVSPMTEGLNEAQTQAIVQSIPTGTLGKPEDIAACALYLASAEAHYVTGQTLHVNGGMAMI